MNKQNTKESGYLAGPRLAVYRNGMKCVSEAGRDRIPT